MVVGLGRSGLASARFLKKHGAFVIGFDEKQKNSSKKKKMMHKSYLMKSIIVRFLMSL
ncbi:hypothetical protein [Caldicellulosiruptor bescii]|uniref:hypothetical protein n=1 Tax=Caldicellulosiruptor bescii TaxID=31899 RepID=UPI002117FDAF|nr:hypothetical protein [Caldicellulosiruptor bescii]